MSQHNTNNYAVIVDYLRTPFAKAAIYGTGKAPGRLADINPVDLQVPLINAMLERTGIDPNHVKKVLTGCVHQEGPQGLDIARHNVLHEESLLPHSVGGTTLDRFCASSMEALSFADGLVGRNPDAVYICTGVQSMSQVPIGGHNPDLNDKVHAGNAPAFMDMASTAENLAVLYGITREEQDAYSLRSHQLHAKAADEGRFKDEILPLKQLAQDDGVRRDTTMAALAKLPTTAKAKEKGGTITPGSSSQVTDGASAAIVTSEAYARANNLPVLGRIIAVGESGCAPEIMGIGPVEASKEAFRKS
ncbi:MAG TPA: thiolase family protein, partial [Alphaproteobacteria bacterium]|nr:thiolase family protein [Alphaproteobacteria bacterium]